MKPLMVTDDVKEQGCWRLYLCSHSCSIAQSFNPLLTRALVKNSFPGWGCCKLAKSQLSLSITCGFLTALPSYLIVCWCTHLTSRYLQAPVAASFVPAPSTDSWGLAKVRVAGWNPGSAARIRFAFNVRDLHTLLVFLPHALAGS